MYVQEEVGKFRMVSKEADKSSKMPKNRNQYRNFTSIQIQQKVVMAYVYP